MSLRDFIRTGSLRAVVDQRRGEDRRKRHTGSLEHLGWCMLIGVALMAGYIFGVLYALSYAFK